MIILQDSNDSLEIILASAIATNQLPYYVSYVDSTNIDYTPAESNGLTNGVTAVPMVNSPSLTTTGLVNKRTVKYISIHNNDTAIER